MMRCRPSAPAGRHRWLPFPILLLALSSVFLFGGDRGYFYGYDGYPISDWTSARWMNMAAHFSFEQGFLIERAQRRGDGSLRYQLYSRFPAGGVALLKLATAPFEGDLFRQLVAARTLMLVFFCGAAVVAYLSLVRLCGDRWIALAATAWAFCSYHMAGYKDVVNGEVSMDLFALLLVFHGMVLFVQEGRFWQLPARVAVALLLGWHVYALLAPFVAWGLAAALRRAWSPAAAGAPGGRRGRAVATMRRLAAAGLRCRPLLVGLFALLFGLGVLGFNVAREHAAFEGQRQVAELPVVKSMLRRTGLNDVYDRVWAREGAAGRFLKWQLHRIGLMLVPHALVGRVELLRLGEDRWEALGAATFAPLGALGCCACVGALCLVRRGRAPFAILAASGLVWGLAIRNNTVITNHDFESLYYVGIPLVLVALGLMGLCKALRRHGGFAVVAVAGLAAGLFAVSHRAMAAARADPHEAAAQREIFAEFDAMRPLARGKDVLNAARHAGMFEAFERKQVHLAYNLAGAIWNEGVDARALARLEAEGCCDFVLSRRRLALPSLLTPAHRHWFLYRAGGVVDAVRRARRDELQVLRAGGRIAAAHYDVHLRPRGRAGAREQLFYVREPCADKDTQGLFVKRFASGDPSRSARLLAFRAGRTFHFDGARAGSACVLRIDPPPGAVQATLQQFAPDGGERWGVAVRLDVHRLRRARDAVGGTPPVAAGEFDVFWRDGTLTYLRAPCGFEHVRDRFFLHVVPLASSRRGAPAADGGFINLDFHFGERGARIDGACVATVPLPYPAAHVRTGQLASGAPRWDVRFKVAKKGAEPTPVAAG